MQYLIATHSNMASGLKDAIRLLYGNTDNIHVITAYVNSDDFEKEFLAELDTIEDDKIIVLTELLVGSVNQTVMKYRGEKKIELISGVNLALVLRILYLDQQQDISEQIRQYVEYSREQIIYVNKLLNQSMKGEENGI